VNTGDHSSSSSSSSSTQQTEPPIGENTKIVIRFGSSAVREKIMTKTELQSDDSDEQNLLVMDFSDSEDF